MHFESPGFFRGFFFRNCSFNKRICSGLTAFAVLFFLIKQTDLLRPNGLRGLFIVSNVSCEQIRLLKKTKIIT